MAVALADSISTVGGTLLVKEEEYANKLFFNKSPDPILEDHSVGIQEKLPYSNTVDFVLIETHGGGNGVPPKYCLLKISRNKSWKLIDLPIATWNEVSLSKEGEYIKAIYSEKHGYQTEKTTITINADGEKVKEEKELSGSLPEIKNFNELKKNMTTIPGTEHKYLKPVAFIQLPGIKEDLKKKGLYNHLINNLGEIDDVNVETTKDGNTIFAYVNGSHAENWTELAIEVDKEGAYFVLFPAPNSFGPAQASFEIYSNYSDKTIKQLLRAFLKNGTFDWFTKDSFKSSSLFINGKKIK